MARDFINEYDNIIQPCIGAVSITPADSDLADVTNAVYVGTGGDLVVIMVSGETVTFANVFSGTVLPIRVKQVKAATTASDVLGLY